VDEPKSKTVKQAVHQADAVATSLLAYTGARAAFARSRREGNSLLKFTAL